MLPPSNHIHDFHGIHSRRRSDSRSTADHYSTATPMAMQVPNRRPPEPPPALPPPRYVSDDPPDHDERRTRGYGGRRVEHREPSGVGLSFPKNWGSSGASMEERRLPERLDFRRRDDPLNSINSINSLRSPTDSDRRYEASRSQDEGYYSLSIPSQMTQQSVFALLALFRISVCSPIRLQ